MRTNLSNIFQLNFEGKFARIELLFVLIFFSLISLFLFREVVFNGKIPIAADLQVGYYEPWHTEMGNRSFKPLGFDDVRIFYPQRLFTTKEILSGNLPLWDPYEFSGNVHLANSQTAVFYPPFWIFLVIDPKLAWTLMVFIIPVLAGLFTYRFLRLWVKPISALMGSAAFVLSGFMIVRFEDGLIVGHTALWLPLVLLGLERIKCGETKRGFLTAVLAMIMSILAGWFQMTFYVLAFSFFFAIYRKIDWKKILLVFSTAIILTFYHWLPAAQALTFSPRGNATSVNISSHQMDFTHLLTLLAPDLFGNPVDYSYFEKSEYKEAVLFVGLVPLALAILIAIKSKRKSPVSFFVFSTLAGLTLGLNIPGLNFLFRQMPLVSSFLPNRVFFIASFSICILSSFGLELVIQKKSETINLLKKILAFICLISFLILSGFVLIYINEKFLVHFTHLSLFAQGLERYILVVVKGLREGIFYAILLSLATFFWAKRVNSTKIFVSMLFFILFVSQFIFADRYLYFSSPANLFPAHPVLSFLQSATKSDFSRIATFGFARFTSNTMNFYNLYSVDGVDAMYPVWYGQLMGYVATKGKSFAIQDRISTWYDPPTGNRENWLSPFVVNFLKITGIRYIVFRKDYSGLPPADHFRLAFRYNDWFVYEYLDVVPKVQYVYNYEIAPNPKMHLNILFSKNFVPNYDVVLFDNPNFVADRCSLGEAQLLSYNSNSMSIKVNATNPGMVVINDNYFPNWRAKIDGVTTRIFRANYAFRAVAVPAGEHQIELMYSYF